MAETTYTYSIANDFPVTGFDSSRMNADIRESAIVIALERIVSEGDVVDIVFKDALSAGDKTILDGDTTNPAGGLIAAHTAEPVPDSPTPITTEVEAADGTPIFAYRPLLLGRESLKRTDNGTESMNVDGTPSGTSVVLWNGTGAGDTGGDWTPAGVGSESASADAGSGTNGWDTGVTSSGDNLTFDNGSLIDIDGTYDSLTFQIQPKAYPVGSRLRVCFLDAANNRVGNLLRVDNYNSNMDLDVWQQVSIPISDFALTGDAQKLRFRTLNSSGQQYWLDDIELVGNGGSGPYRFQIAAPAGQRYHLSMLVLQVSAPETGWNNDAFANIASGLSNGLICRQRRLSDSEILWKFNTKDNKELFGQYHPQESFAFADSTLLVGFMIKPGKASVIVSEDEVLEFVVRDNLSTVTDIRAYMHYGVEEVA